MCFLLNRAGTIRSSLLDLMSHAGENAQKISSGHLACMFLRSYRSGFGCIDMALLPKVLINYYLKSLMTDGGDDDIFCLQHQGITGFTHRPPRWQGLRPVTSENRSEGETRGEHVG